MAMVYRCESCGVRLLRGWLVVLFLIFPAFPARSIGNKSTPVLPFEIVGTYPHDPEAFTQGLLYHEGKLLESTGLRGASTVRRVDLKTGRVLSVMGLDSAYFGEGLAIFEKKIFQLTWQAGKALTYDLGTFKPKKTFSFQGEGWGLTTDGSSLLMSDGSEKLYFRDPATFRIQKELAVRDHGIPIKQLNELEYFENAVWANVWQTNKIARIDPKSGDVTAWLDLTPLLHRAIKANKGRQIDVLNGIAYRPDTQNILVTGKFWSVLFEIKIRKNG